MCHTTLGYPKSCDCGVLVLGFELPSLGPGVLVLLVYILGGFGVASLGFRV